MFSWLKNWFPHEQQDLYHPRERAIYQYFDGIQVVRTDPMILYKRLMDTGPELDVDIKVANSQSKDANQAYEEMLGKIRRIFSLKPLAEGGLTETETVGLLEHFIQYNENLKKKVKTCPTSSASSGASRSSLAANPGTPPSTASGSTASGGSTSKPRPSPSALASPPVP